MGLKLVERINDFGDFLGANRTKVGLKRGGPAEEESSLLRANRTKVGLKQGVYIEIGEESLWC